MYKQLDLIAFLSIVIFGSATKIGLVGFLYLIICLLYLCLRVLYKPKPKRKNTTKQKRR